MPRPTASRPGTVLATHAGLALLWWTTGWPFGEHAAQVVFTLGAVLFVAGCAVVGWRQYRRVRAVVERARADREIRRLRTEHGE